MSDTQSTVSQADEVFPIARADPDYYTQWQVERHEILKLKWLESEKEGRDIGYLAAQLRWDMNHRQTWLREWREKMRLV